MGNVGLIINHINNVVKAATNTCKTRLVRKSETCWTHCPQGFSAYNTLTPQDLIDSSWW